MSILIRAETEADFESIWKVTERAFLPMSFSNGDEQYVIERLRASNNLTLSLVAVVDERIVGHIAFSPAMLNGEFRDWYALGPVSVLPEYQGIGIGSELINSGIEMLRGNKAQGCILTGNPLFYNKFGFEVAPDAAPSSEPKDYFMLNQFVSKKPSGVFAFDPAFYGQ